MPTRADELYLRIINKLGSEFVEVELTPQAFGYCLNEAIEVYTPYVNDLRTLSFTAAKRIDLSPYNVQEVLKVYESPYGVRNVEFDPLAVLVNGTKMNFQTFANRQMILSEIDALTRKHFRYEHPYLYLDGYNGLVTVEYYPEFTFEDLADELAISWISAYTQALCKEVVGRIRSKAVPTNLPVEFDGPSLLQEANEEKQRLQEQIREQGLGSILSRR